MKSRRSKAPEEKGSKSSRNEVGNSMPVPVELIIEIFSRLPAKSVARCRCVSKSWASVLRRPDFTESFFTRSSARPQLLLFSNEYEWLRFFSAPQVQNLDENSSRIVVNQLMKFDSTGFYSYLGSVRGLVCFSHVKRASCERMLLICNPSTGQSLQLPSVSVKTKKKPMVFEVMYFGYDPIQELYKVLCILTDEGPEEHHVLTLGTGKLSWRKIDCCLPRCAEQGHICINGLLYYVAHVRSSYMLVCFDCTTEKFRVIKATEFTIRAGTLVNYNGKLASLSSEENLIYGRSKSFEMCILEDPEKHEWSKHVYELPPEWQNILGETVLRFAGVTGTNEIVLYKVNPFCPFYVIYYNIKRKLSEKLRSEE